MSIWDKYPNFAEDELRTVVALTAQVLLESETDAAEVPQDVLHLSTLSVSRQLLPLLQEEAPSLDRQEIQQLLEDEDLSAQVSLKVLEEVRKHPELADRVARAYDARAGKMAIPETLLLTGALVILAIKIKEISWGKGGGKIKFDEAGETVKRFITGLLTGK